MLKTLVTEKILTSYTDESGKKGKGSYEIVYSSTGHFDVLNGKWIKKEGVIIFEFDIKEKSKQIMSVAMKEL